MSEDDAPQFHDRLSIHPASVKACREALLRAGATEQEVDVLSDFEAVLFVEKAHRGVRQITRNLQGMNRAMKGTVARLAELHEAMMPLAADVAATELEAFLAVDHSD